VPHPSKLLRSTPPPKYCAYNRANGRPHPYPLKLARCPWMTSSDVDLNLGNVLLAVGVSEVKQYDHICSTLWNGMPPPRSLILIVTS